MHGATTGRGGGKGRRGEGRGGGERRGRGGEDGIEGCVGRENE